MKTRMLIAVLAAASAGTAVPAAAEEPIVFQPGHPSLKRFLLPERPPHPVGNAPNPERVELGKMLFFDPRLSRDGNMSCASCHNPSLGWSDGLPTARGAKSQVLGRATPTVTNTGFNSIQMWDGRKATLEDQAMGPMEASVEMNADLERVFKWLGGNAEYRASFARAYPGEGVNRETFSKAIASFERTVVSNDSPFDRWAKGDARAMSPAQVRGFQLFAGKGNCLTCHSGANFTDNGFHNVGLASSARPDADPGRFAERPLPLMKGAFKTPTVRDVEYTAPYFHDGSAKTLMEVVEHYDRGGDVKNVSPNMRPLGLSAREKEDLVAFMLALSSPPRRIVLPVLPKD